MYAALLKWSVLAGLLASAGAHAADCSMHCGSYSMEVLDEWGQPLPTFEHNGRSFVLGTQGQRYLIRVHNYSSRRVEIVGSVDGRDVMDGHPAGWEKRGYIVSPNEEVTIDGFRLNEQAVAAFRFSSVARSYAAQMGDAREVGVIGVAVFSERVYAPPLAWRSGTHSSAASAPSPPPSPSGAASSGLAEDSITSSHQARKAAPAEERPGLGTEFGEEHASQVYATRFERAGAHPDTVLRVNYNDRQGLSALGIDVNGRNLRADDGWLRYSAEPFPRNETFSQPPPGWHP
jgi:hypothetical protein